MKGETLLSVQELALVMVLFTAAVIGIVIAGLVVFKRWRSKEDECRGRQIAMASLDPECVEIKRDRHRAER